MKSPKLKIIKFPLKIQQKMSKSSSSLNNNNITIIRNNSPKIELIKIPKILNSENKKNQIQIQNKNLLLDKYQNYFKNKTIRNNSNNSYRNIFNKDYNINKILLYKKTRTNSKKNNKTNSNNASLKKEKVNIIKLPVRKCLDKPTIKNNNMKNPNESSKEIFQYTNDSKQDNTHLSIKSIDIPTDTNSDNTSKSSSLFINYKLGKDITDEFVTDSINEFIQNAEIKNNNIYKTDKKQVKIKNETYFDNEHFFENDEDNYLFHTNVRKPNKNKKRIILENYRKNKE